MSTAPPDRDADAAASAGHLREAAFVRVVTRADADGVAAAGVLARALADSGVPIQVSAARTDEARGRRVERAGDHAAPDDATVVVGATGADGDSPTGVPGIGGADAPEIAGRDAVRVAGGDRPDSVAAWELAREIAGPEFGSGDGRDHAVGTATLALAGAVAAGATPDEDGTDPVLSAAREAGVERRPGVALPTRDAADGLAHSTLVHAPFSGDADAASGALAETFDDGSRTDADPHGTAGIDPADPDAGRDLASLVALRVAGAEGASHSAGFAVERALRPHATPSGPFATVGGLADVLEATARESPGTAVALALGHDAADPALAAWRDRAGRAHRAVRSADAGRYDGVLAARVESSPVGTVAGLLAAYRSPEPVALVVGDGEAAAAYSPDATGEGDPRAALRTAATAVDAGAEVGGTRRRAYARFDGHPDRSALVGAFREALS